MGRPDSDTPMISCVAPGGRLPFSSAFAASPRSRRPRMKASSALFTSSGEPAFPGDSLGSSLVMGVSSLWIITLRLEAAIKEPAAQYKTTTIQLLDHVCFVRAGVRNGKVRIAVRSKVDAAPAHQFFDEGSGGLVRTWWRHSTGIERRGKRGDPSRLRRDMYEERRTS